MNSEYLKSILDYNPYNGIFKWKISKGTSKRGCIAGSKNKQGYWLIRIDKKAYYAHRLAWLYAYDAFPVGQIDHKDRDKLNNSLENLRDCTQSDNQRNIKRVWGKSKYLGVGFHKKSKKWVARIRKNGKQMHIGLFEDEVEAASRYDEYAKKYYGSFAITNF